MKALLRGTGNKSNRTVEVPLPISEDSYETIIRDLSDLGMGSATVQDCLVAVVNGNYPILKRMEDTLVNIDELDYLANWLETAPAAHVTAFQGLAAKHGTWRIQDFISLTQCCHKATVITDFSNLENIGWMHYKTRCPNADEQALRKVDPRAEALNLILNMAGAVTPYGVVYENGMDTELYRAYSGGPFPKCDRPGTVLRVIMSPRNVDWGSDTYLNLPVCDLRLKRALARSGIRREEQECIAVCCVSAPAYASELDYNKTTFEEWNALSWAISRLDDADKQKLGAVMEYAKPKTAERMMVLAEHLDLFTCKSAKVEEMRVTYHGERSLETLMHTSLSRAATGQIHKMAQGISAFANHSLQILCP